MHKNFGEAIVRSPLLEIENLQKIRLEILSGDAIINAITSLCSDKVLSALYISSPDFARVIQRIVEKDTQNFSDAKLIDIWLSFVKYYSRMCTRTTPYGLMSSVGTISFDDYSILQAQFKESIHPQLDNEIVRRIINLINKSDVITKTIKYFPNPSIYLHGNRLKYIEETNQNGKKTFSLSKVERNNVLNEILNFTINGKNKLEIEEHIITKFSHAYESVDLRELLSDLISNQLLLNDVSSSATKHTPFELLLEHLKNNHVGSDIAKKVFEIYEDICTIKQFKLDSQISLLKKIEYKLNDLIQLDSSSSIFHFNFLRSFADSKINRKVITRVQHCVELVASINDFYKSDELERFKAEFIRRYEHQYVPLPEILDEEIGIGYPVGSIRNKNIDGTFDGINIFTKKFSEESGLKLNDFYVFLLNRIHNDNCRNTGVLNINSKDLEKFRKENTTLPPSFSVFCTLLASTPQDIDKDNYKLLILNSAYTSASSPINRFSVSDVEIEKLCQNIFDEEKLFFKDKIVAEVLHTSNSRLENICFRKVSRDFEIPIETLSNIHSSKQIKLKDILVSVVNNRVVLIRKKDRKEIIPKISNNHFFNDQNSLPAYRLLGEIQIQEQQNNLVWLWGPLAKLEFLPRVVLDENIIYCPATWRISIEKMFFEEAVDAKSELKAKLIRLGLPRHIALRQNGDHLLVLDIEDVSCLAILIKEFKNNHALIIHEYLSAAENSFIKDLEGNHFVNELIIPFVQSNKGKDNGNDNVMYNHLTTLEKRSFLPGEDFLYLKVYCSRDIAQTILTQDLARLFTKIGRYSDSMFFIRYEDPDFHIRLRIRKKDNHLLIPKIKNTLKKYIKHKLVHKMQIDTYQRELNRYSLIPYDKTESIFHADSIAILKTLQFLKKNDIESLTWIIAIKNIHSYLETFDFSPSEIYTFSESIKTAFFKEFNFKNKDFLKSMNIKLRGNIQLIDSVISETNPDFTTLYKILNQRRSHIVSALHDKEKEKLRHDYGQCSSYIHMSLNRLFASDQRLKEAMIYDLLFNYLVIAKKLKHLN